MNNLSKLLDYFKTVVSSDHRRIMRGIFLVGTFSLAVKVVGAIKEVAIANRFGTAEMVDIYMLVFVFVMWIPGISVSVFNTIYIPLIHKLPIEQKDTFKKQVTGATLILAGTVIIASFIALPLILERLTTSYSEEAQTTLRTLTLYLTPIAGIGIITAQLSTMLLAEEKHANTLLNAMPPLILTLFVLLWPLDNSINPLLWGTLIGFVFQATGLLLLLINSNSFPKPTLSLSSPGWKELKSIIGVVLLAQLVMSFIEPISNAIASQLGAGNVSSLGYSTRILALILTLGATAVSRAILPVLSNTHRTKLQRIRLAEQWAYTFLSLGVIASILVWIITPQLVKILLERGAFTATDTFAVARAIRFGVAQFPFYFAGIIFAQLFISLGLHRVILITSILALITKVTFSLLLAPKYSFAGIVFATVPMYFTTVSYFFWATRRLKIKISQNMQSAH